MNKVLSFSPSAVFATARSLIKKRFVTEPNNFAMTSTPSASALTAVLRCRGNLFARNQANKKRPPAGSGYSLGLKCSTAAECGAPAVGRDCNVEPCRIFLRFSSFPRERGAARPGISVQVRHADVGRLNVRVPRDAARCGAGLKMGFDLSETLSLMLGLRKGCTASGSGAKIMGDATCSNTQKLLLSDRLNGTPRPKCLSATVRHALNLNKRWLDTAVRSWASIGERCSFLGSLVSGVLRRRPENPGGERKVHTCGRRTGRRL